MTWLTVNLPCEFPLKTSDWGLLASGSYQTRTGPVFMTAMFNKLFVSAENNDLPSHGPQAIVIPTSGVSSQLMYDYYLKPG